MGKLYGLVGVFENYTFRSTAETFDTTPGIHYGAVKRAFEQYLAATIRIIHDPFYIPPAAFLYGERDFNLNLAYLCTQILNETVAISRFEGAFAMHSVIDLYAEIVMNYRRQKWLEPLIARRVAAYDKLIHIPLDYQLSAERTPQAKKYNTICARLIHDFKGNYLRVNENEDTLITIAKI
jgi:hypothetical protein